MRIAKQLWRIRSNKLFALSSRILFEAKRGCMKIFKNCFSTISIQCPKRYKTLCAS
jgi:hypothetical protein